LPWASGWSEEAARVQGIPVDALNLLVTFLAAITVVVAMRVVGVLLTSALIVIPAVTALRVARSFRGALWLAVGASVAAVLAGMTAAFYLDLAAGGAIVLTAILLFAASGPLARRRA